MASMIVNDSQMDEEVHGIKLMIDKWVKGEEEDGIKLNGSQDG